MNLHVRTKLLLIVIAVTTIALFVFSKLIVDDSRKQITELLDTQALYQVKTLAEGSLDGIVSEDYELLERWVKSSLPSDAFAYAFLSRPNGQVLTHTDGKQIGEFITPVEDNNEVHNREKFVDGRLVKEVIYSARLGNKTIAFAHIGYYQDRAYALLRHTTTNILFISLFIIAFIVIGIRLATRTITSPIERLTTIIGNVNLERKLIIDRSISGRHDEIGVLASRFQDMSENLVDSHNELMESLSVNKMIVDSAMDGVIIFDTQGHVVSANAAAEGIFNFNSGDLIGKDVGLILPQLRKTLNAITMDGIVESETLHQIDQKQSMLAMKNGGDKFPVQIYVRMIESGKVRKYACVIHDFSERVKYENALLEEKKKAEAGNQAKSNFLSVMSHEIRTPINGVLGSLDLIRDEESAEQRKVYFDGAYSSARKMSELVDNILQFTIISDKSVQKKDEVIRLEQLITSINTDVKEDLIDKNVQFECECNKNVPESYLGDWEYTRKVLVILIRNAIKFTPEGSVTLKISRDDSKGSERCLIVYEVIDTGVGISKKEQERIFELFTQADSSYSRGHMGVGLGLALCRELLRVMGGEISVESEPGRGSKFSVALPYEDVPSDRIGPDEIAESKGLSHSHEIRKVLVAEDDKVNQVLIRSYVKKLGYEVTLVGNGEEAVEEMRTHSYDLILMDCQMPIMDGYRATSIIRNELNKDLPIIAVTANVAKEDKEKCFEVGMNDYISKPFNMATLRNTISRLTE